MAESPPETSRLPFPKDTADFEQDPRVSYSRADENWILEDDDGTEFEWVTSGANGGHWTQTLDESLIEQQRSAYAVPGVDENAPVQPPKKRKTSSSQQDDQATAAPSNKKAKNANIGRKNTAVYVTNVPSDADVEEVKNLFSRCGVIAQEIDSGKPRIKLYHDDDGNFKGDALIVYFRAESVALAVQMLDDSDFRFGESSGAPKMRVSEADWSYKKVKENQADSGATANSNKTSGKKPPKGKPGDDPMKNSNLSTDKKKIIRKTQQLNARLADWSDEDDDLSAITDTSSRFDKVVVLKHMFTLQELEEDPAAMLDIKEDVREEAEKLGPVTNVVLFDAEEDGVITIRFGNAQAAAACVSAMNGRHFDQRVVEAYTSNGKERFKKTKKDRRHELEDSDESSSAGEGEVKAKDGGEEAEKGD
ncbi:MAG: hypothetical protein M1831_003028 [Alyxoria varia]|nr:MAG: hypothetical protein M1831_003028 [Alyxoria varia]